MKKFIGDNIVWLICVAWALPTYVGMSMGVMYVVRYVRSSQIEELTHHDHGLPDTSQVPPLQYAFTSFRHNFKLWRNKVKHAGHDVETDVHEMTM